MWEIDTLPPYNGTERSPLYNYINIGVSSHAVAGSLACIHMRYSRCKLWACLSLVEDLIMQLQFV